MVLALQVIITRTPTTSLKVHHLKRIYQINSNSALVKKIFKANKSLATQYFINTHTITRLQAALANEKKKKKRKKKLNFLGKKDKGNSKFYSPNKVKRAREYNMTKKITETQN